MKMEENNQDGVCLGISGDIDSSVAAAVCVDALGDPSKVHGLHLYDRDSSEKFTKTAKDLVEQLEINYEARANPHEYPEL